MNTECKVAFNKAKELIELNKEKFDVDAIPKIHSFGYDNVHAQYFLNWEDFWKKTKLKRSKIKVKDIELVFLEEGNDVKIDNFDNNKTYMVLEGEINFKFEDGSIQKVSSYQSFDIPKGIVHDTLIVKDTYVVVVQS